MRTLLISTLFLLSLSACHSQGYSGPRTDHFNGEQFHNQTPPKKRVGFIALYLWFQHLTNPWPKQPPNPPHPPITTVASDTVRITFVGHSTALIQSKDYAILTDPIWSQRASPFSWIGPTRVKQPGIDFSELPKIDAVVISHNHYDHMDIPTLQRLAKAFDPIFFVPLGNKALLEQNGITRVVELDWWQSYTIPNGTITLLPTQHWSARWLNDKNETLWGSYGIQLGKHRVYFAGDTGYSEKIFTDIQKRFGSPDVALLPIGAYKPRSIMEQNHITPAEAVKTMQDLQAKNAIAIHYGTFHLGTELYHEAEKDLDLARKEAKISEQTFFILPEGFGWELNTPIQSEATIKKP